MSTETREGNGTTRKAARIRLILAAAVFAGWIGWLAYLAVTASRPTVMSRPQILLAAYDVLAEVRAVEDGPAPEVTIREVYWPSADPEKLQGRLIMVHDLPRTAEDGWKGPGLYLLPLTRIEDQVYHVVAVPPSPGYKQGQHLIYAVTQQNKREVEIQLESLPKPAPEAADAGPHRNPGG
jgi:hypothetical protein